MNPEINNERIASRILSLLPLEARTAFLRNKIKSVVAEELQGERALADWLRKMLNEHHARASEPCEVFFEQDGKPVEISICLGEAYEESDFYERTVACLASNYDDAVNKQS